MAELELVEERFISGRGVLRVPEAAKKNRFFILYTDVIRDPRSKYINKNYNPDRSRYGNIIYLRNSYVIGSDPIEFERQSWDGVNDVSGQTLIAVKCAYDGLLNYLDLAFLSLGAPPFPRADLIKDYENLRLAWDEIRIACYADTALQVRLYTQEYDSCTPDRDKDTPPPPPPPPLPKLPPGTPIGDLSSPYDDADNDGGNTDPFDGDDFTPPPVVLPDNSRLKWNLSTSRNPRNSFAQAVFTTFTPVSSYSVTAGNTDEGANAKEWLATFVSGTTTVNGSAVGNNNPEDKPLLYLWDENDSTSPYRVLEP